MDQNGQTAAEFILLFGGIMVVVLLAIHMYNSYMADLTEEVNSKEVKEFNNGLMNIEKYFNWVKKINRRFNF